MNPDTPTTSTGAQPGKEAAPRDVRSSRPPPAHRPAEGTPEFDFGPEPELAPFAPIVIKPKPPEPSMEKPSMEKPSVEKPAPAAPQSGSVYFSRGDSDRSSVSRPAVTRPSAETPPAQPSTPGKSMPLQTPAVSEFRKNVERQTREQRAVGDVLSWIGYSLLGGLIVVALMAGFGGYTLYRMIEDQSVTVAQFDAKYGAETAALHENVKELDQQMAQTRNLVGRQQDQITRLSSRVDEANAVIKTQKQIIDRDLTDLKGRVRRMEGVRP
jgi:hypothetical protein